MRSARPSIEPRLNKNHLATLWGLDLFFVCIVLDFQDHLIFSEFWFHKYWPFFIVLVILYILVFPVFITFSEFMT